MTHLCTLLATSLKSRAQMMSFWGLCSAWSVPLWLHLDSPLEEFNLHHTPRRSIPLFYQSVFRGITLAQRNPPSHLSLKADSSGESDSSAISFQKRNIIFNFLWVRVVCILWLRSGTEEGRHCQNYLPSGELILTQSVNPERVIPPPALSESAHPRQEAVSGRCAIIIGHEMLLAS